MPYGGEAVGFAALVLVKLGGYTGAAQVLRKAYDVPTSAWKVGAARTGIGLAAGMAVLGAWSTLEARSNVGWFISLLPVRILEWGFLLYTFFERSFLGPSRSWKYAIAGTVFSFALDAVGVGAALVVPGGFWVC